MNTTLKKATVSKFMFCNHKRHFLHAKDNTNNNLGLNRLKNLDCLFKAICVTTTGDARLKTR